MNYGLFFFVDYTGEKGFLRMHVHLFQKLCNSIVLCILYMAYEKKNLTIQIYDVISIRLSI